MINDGGSQPVQQWHARLRSSSSLPQQLDLQKNAELAFDDRIITHLGVQAESLKSTIDRADLPRLVHGTRGCRICDYCVPNER